MTIVAGPKAQVRSLLGGRYRIKSKEQMVLTLGFETLWGIREDMQIGGNFREKSDRFYPVLICWYLGAAE